MLWQKAFRRGDGTGQEQPQAKVVCKKVLRITNNITTI